LTITKIHASKPEKQVSFAHEEDLLTEILLLEKQYRWPITQLFKLLMLKRADTFSITVDNPYFYFYARRVEDAISLVTQKEGAKTEFKITIQTIKKHLAVVEK
jgi:hypothetical protein